MKSVVRSGRSGFTMVEAVVAAALLVIMSSVALLASNTGLGAFESARANTRAEARLQRALKRASFELMPSSWDMVGPLNLDDEFGSSFVTFQTPAGFANDAIVWGPVNWLGLELEPGEQDNGVDDDGDGLVDERQLVLVRDQGGADEIRSVLTHNVREFLEGEEDNNVDDNGNDVTDERGFNAHRDGDVLTLRLSIEEFGDKTGTVVRTLTTSVRLRN